MLQLFIVGPQKFPQHSLRLLSRRPGWTYPIHLFNNVITLLMHYRNFFFRFGSSFKIHKPGHCKILFDCNSRHINTTKFQFVGFWNLICDVLYNIPNMNILYNPDNLKHSNFLDLPGKTTPKDASNTLTLTLTKKSHGTPPPTKWRNIKISPHVQRNGI